MGGKCTACKMDVVTKKSGHTMTGCAVSVCITPAAPSPIPIPYPTVGSVSEGITDPCLRTKIGGAIVMTVGSCMAKCHGNEPGTLKEVVSLNTAGPCFPIMGAPMVFMELGMAGITTSPGQMNKSITVGASGTASGAGGGGSGAGGGAGGAAGPPGANTQGPGGGGGSGGGSNDGAAAPSPPAPPSADGQATAGHPIDVITGAMFTAHTDFTLPGFLWVQWRRSYQTSAVRQRVGIGWGWSHALAWRARVRGDRLTLLDDQLRETELELPAEGTTAVLDYGRKLRREAVELVLDLGDGLERVLRRSKDDPRRYYLSALRDEHGNNAQIRWRGDEVAEIVDTVGRHARLEESGNFRIWEVGVTDADGELHRRRLVSYEIDERGDLVRVIDAGGAETRYAYDDDHYLVAETRADGVVYHFVYAEVRGEKRCIETWGEIPGEDILALIGDPRDAPERARGVHHARLEYGPGPYETRVRDALGHLHRYEGNRFGLVERYVDPRGYATVLRYDDQGKLLSHTDGAGRTTRWSYNQAGLLSSLNSATGSFRYEYDEALELIGVAGPGGARWSNERKRGKVVAESDGRGGEITYSYDERGLRTEVVKPDGFRQSMSYDAFGNIRRIEDSTGAVWEYAFDLFGRPVQIKTPAGAEYHLAYDSRGDLSVVTGPDGYRAEYDNDAMRRMAAIGHPGGETTACRYVGDALVERIYPDGSTWRMGYDALLRLRWIENPAGERHFARYDGAGHLTEYTTFSGLHFENEFDGAGKRIAIVRPDGSRVETQRNAAGLPVGIRYAATPEVRFEYDATGAVVRAVQGATTVDFRYDELGQLRQEVQHCGDWRFTVEYERDEQGAVVAQRYSTGWGVHYDYGATGLMTSLRVVEEGASEHRLLFAHDANGQEIERRWDSSPLAVRTERSKTGQPTSLAVSNEEDVLRQRRFVWDAKGPLAAIDDSARGSRQYRLDEVGRPLEVRGLGGSERFQYTPHGTPVPEDQAWSVGANGRPLRTATEVVEWDALGRLSTRQTAQGTVRYRYDDADRLVEVEREGGHTIRYIYDAFNRRLAATDGTTTTYFGYDGDSIVEECDLSGRGTRRVFARNEVTPLFESESDASGRRSQRMLVTDGASVPWLYLGKEGIDAEIDLSAWGVAVFVDGKPGSLRFAGQRADRETGLHYNRHRYYAPDLHVFLTPDPIGLEGSFQDIGFVPNATFYIDALGLWVAIIQGQDESPRTRQKGGAVDMAVGQYHDSHPGSRVIRHDQLGPGSLAGATQVIVISHGAPGGISWGPHRPIIGPPSISGEQLGDILNNAGFDGTQPGARVDVLSCNAATPGLLGGDSVAQGVANRTLAETTGARADNRLLGALSMTGTTATRGSGAYTSDSPRAGQRFYVPPQGPAHESVTGGQMVTVSPRPATR
jgi:RHS repeat-associated protein